MTNTINMIDITIDGKPLQVAPGTTVIYDTLRSALCDTHYFEERRDY